VLSLLSVVILVAIYLARAFKCLYPSIQFIEKGHEIITKTDVVPKL